MAGGALIPYVASSSVAMVSTGEDKRFWGCWEITEYENMFFMFTQIYVQWDKG